MKSAAERRWNEQLLRQFASKPLTYSEIVNGIDGAMQEAATQAELVRPGAGFTYITEALGVWTGRANRRIGSNGRNR
jgi:hypothetical protein